MTVYKVLRRDKDDCVVMIFYDRKSKKYRFVNLTSRHICTCEFNTVADAIEDMEKREEVVCFYVLEL